MVDQIVEASLACGINWLDTAEMYGHCTSQRALAAALQHAAKKKGDVVLAMKWWSIFRTANSIRTTIRQRLSCLAPFGIDLHQVHNPAGLCKQLPEKRFVALKLAIKFKSIHATSEIRE